MQPNDVSFLRPAPPAGGSRAARVRLLERTKLGIAFLIVSVLLQWIPIIQYLGLLLGAIGVIFILLGSEAFRRQHLWLVLISILIYILAEVAEVVLAFGFASSVTGIPANASGPTVEPAVLSAFDAFLIGSAFAVAFVTASFALILFDISDREGRLILVSGVLVQILISSVVLGLVVLPLIHHAIAEAFATTPVNVSAIEAADAQIRGMGAYTLLNGLPAILFAWGYYRAYDRVRRMAAGPPAPAAFPPPPSGPEGI